MTRGRQNPSGSQFLVCLHCPSSSFCIPPNYITVSFVFEAFVANLQSTASPSIRLLRPRILVTRASLATGAPETETVRHCCAGNLRARREFRECFFFYDTGRAESSVPARQGLNGKSSPVQLSSRETVNARSLRRR